MFPEFFFLCKELYRMHKYIMSTECITINMSAEWITNMWGKNVQKGWSTLLLVLCVGDKQATWIAQIFIIKQEIRSH